MNRQELEAEINADQRKPSGIADIAPELGQIVDFGALEGIEPRSKEERDREAQREIEESYRAQRVWKARELIPFEFQQDLDRTNPRVDWKAFDEVLAWDGKRSVLVKGPSQLGKTRAIFQVLYRAMVEQKRSFKVLNERNILAKVADARSEQALSKLSDAWCREDILFFDDLDKVNFHNGVIAQSCLTLVFGVIKERMAQHRPTFLSQNARIQDIFAAAGKPACLSMIERIKQEEHWQVTLFKKGDGE